jgi:hypothetical protein
MFTFLAFFTTTLRVIVSLENTDKNFSLLLTFLILDTVTAGDENEILLTSCLKLRFHTAINCVRFIFRPMSLSKHT